jgi:hypothetical protein
VELEKVPVPSAERWLNRTAVCTGVGVGTLRLETPIPVSPFLLLPQQ